jgi:hypothetical protein
MHYSEAGCARDYFAASSRFSCWREENIMLLSSNADVA